MALTMRPTGLDSQIDIDRGDKDYSVFSREFRVGRIYEIRGGPEHLRWFWALNGVLNKPADLRTDDRVANLEEAKSQLRASWVTWLRWAGLSEMDFFATAIVPTLLVHPGLPQLTSLSAFLSGLVLCIASHVNA